MSYRVELPVFCGPMDLLLHLVKQQEVDIHEVRIANILKQYLDYLKVLEAMDLADLGDFLVMASTLMEIKSRELVPRDAVEVEEELNPRDDLIRRLLEYKRYRDLSRRLHRLAQRRSRMHDVLLPLPKELDEVPEEEEDYLDLGNVEIWTLTAAFAKLLEATGQQPTSLEIGVDKRNMGYWTSHVLQRIRNQKDVRFEALFDSGDGRYGMIGVFIALLEMMKQGVLRAHMGDRPNQIVVAYTGSEDLTAEEILSGGQRIDEDEPDVLPEPELEYAEDDGDSAAEPIVDIAPIELEDLGGSDASAAFDA